MPSTASSGAGEVSAATCPQAVRELQEAVVEPADHLDRRCLADDRRRSVMSQHDHRHEPQPPAALTISAFANGRLTSASSSRAHLADTGAERRAAAETISELGATPVWFEEFGAGTATPRRHT